MADIKTIDKDGEYFINTGLFRQVMVEDEGDTKRPDTPLEPGVIYRIKPNTWLKTQMEAGVIIKVKDPGSDAAQSKADAAKEASRLERNGPDPVPDAPKA